ncbi:heavy-metal-associated domain-containing protein [Labilibacter marinus]|uniref:heavy-metal-associated domain-containing protein n=1 Tax=Labilibacter marinus TaxID=1477105 RepID=UPI00082A8B70|nr:heavy-metal-associated domain-containing protein [Labilibacter marinus]
MKNLKLVLATLILFIGVTSSFAKDKPKVKEVTYSCSVDCHSCKEKIMKNIPYEKGVKSVNVNIEDKLVTVSFREDKNTTEGVKKALEKLDYDVKVMPQTEKK